MNLDANDHDGAINVGYDFARGAEPSAADVDGAMARIYGSGRGTSPLRAALAAPATWAAVALIAGCALAVPAVRAGLVDVAGSFGGYFSDDAAGPGHALTKADDAPAWITREGTTRPRALASAGGYDLFMVEERDGSYSFALDDSFGTNDSAKGWLRQFENNSLVLLGPGVVDGKPGPVPLYGLTAAGVERVEVLYRDGGPTFAPASEGAFVALADPKRFPLQLVALDGDGEILQSIDIASFGWRYHVRAAATSNR